MAPFTSARSGGAAVAAPVRLGAVVEALDGRMLTRGVATVTELGTGWTARLTQLERPGVVASLFFGERARDVVLRLHGGRSARARIASTSFIAASERVCDLEGVEPLAYRLSPGAPSAADTERTAPA